MGLMNILGRWRTLSDEEIAKRLGIPFYRWYPRMGKPEIFPTPESGLSYPEFMRKLDEYRARLELKSLADEFGPPVYAGVRMF